MFLHHYWHCSCSGFDSSFRMFVTESRDLLSRGTGFFTVDTVQQASAASALTEHISPKNIPVTGARWDWFLTLTFEMFLLSFYDNMYGAADSHTGKNESQCIGNHWCLDQECRASDFPRSRKSRGIRGIADLKRNPWNSKFFFIFFFIFFF